MENSTQGPSNGIPEQIEGLVSEHRISYYELAKMMGVSRNSLHRVRKGKRLT